MDLPETELAPRPNTGSTELDTLPDVVNRKLKEKIAKGVTPVSEFRGLPVYRFFDETGVYYCLVEDSDVIYFVRASAVKHSTLPSGHRVLVWRKQLIFAAGFAKTVFFTFLLEEFRTLVADQFQTEDPLDFWDYAITEALRRGLNVYAVDLRSVPSTIKPIRSEEDLRRYYHIRQDADDAHKRMYSIISKVPLRLK